ncbi:MAG: class I SAM-dependent methyltransferase [Chloroflexi bacterium]|nr:class I SAM-dependent methyltransferase [Chloroflexota bacterium]
MTSDSAIGASSPEDVLHVQQDDEEYLKMLREEEEFWDSRTETLLTETPRRSIQRYLNERLTGDPDKRWYQTIGDEGEFTSGCIFGAGPGEIEEHLLGRHPQLNLTIFDISGDALSRLQKRLDQTYPGRAATRQQDLNFVGLPGESYDLAVAISSVHHLVNLEHFAFQVSRSLTSEGRFFMNDVVGESYFQFTEEKKRMFQTYVDATRDSSEPRFKIVWPSRAKWEFSPFECARSGEILDVFARYLSPLRIRTAGALLALTLFRQPDDSRGRLGRAIDKVRARLSGRELAITRGISRGELLFLLDSLMCDSGRLVPGQAFGIYGKRGG